jgi:hypothetical protein
MAEPRVARYTDIVPAKKTVIGSKVVNKHNEDLGKIEDLVLDAGAGRIAYAVLSFGGFLGMGDKYFAIPWNAFHFNLSENRAVLNVEKRLLENAPGFDKDKWSKMVDSDWDLIGRPTFALIRTPPCCLDVTYGRNSGSQS